MCLTFVCLIVLSLSLTKSYLHIQTLTHNDYVWSGKKIEALKMFIIPIKFYIFIPKCERYLIATSPPYFFSWGQDYVQPFTIIQTWIFLFCKDFEVNFDLSRCDFYPNVNVLF